MFSSTFKSIALTSLLSTLPFTTSLPTTTSPINTTTPILPRDGLKITAFQSDHCTGPTAVVYNVDSFAAAILYHGNDANYEFMNPDHLYQSYIPSWEPIYPQHFTFFGWDDETRDICGKQIEFGGETIDGDLGGCWQVTGPMACMKFHSTA